MRTNWAAVLSAFVSLSAVACDFEGARAPDGPDGGTQVDSASGQPGSPFSLATVNLRCLLDDWPARRPLLVDALAAIDADILAFQEICHADDGTDSLDELLALLTDTTGRSYQVVRATTHRSWEIYDEGIALVTHLPLAHESELSIPPGIFPRKAIVAAVTSPLGTLWVGATHLSFGDQANVRQAQLAAIRDSLAGSEKTSSVIMGDMNAPPAEGAVVDALSSGYRDTWAQINPEPGHTYPSSAPSARIDHILLRSETLRARSSSLFLDTPTSGVLPSDHLGVLTVLGVAP